MFCRRHDFIGEIQFDVIAAAVNGSKSKLGFVKSDKWRKLHFEWVFYPYTVSSWSQIKVISHN